jgi:hypothetical protein
VTRVPARPLGLLLDCIDDRLFHLLRNRVPPTTDEIKAMIGSPLVLDGIMARLAFLKFKTGEGNDECFLRLLRRCPWYL